MSVLTEIREDVMILTLNRPEAGNSLNPAAGAGIIAALEVANDSPDIRALVVTGAGAKIFCAGMDLKAFAARENMAPVAQALDKLAKCVKPVIAAVNGMALAGGFEVMMKCDLVVAADHAKFGIPEVKRGLVAGGGGTRLPRRIPLQVALEMGLTGEPISAARALELGLVNRVVPAADVMSTALALAALITANGPLAVQATKRLMWDEVGEDPLQHIGATIGPVFASEDAREGAAAFAQKRPPEWKGR
ncbi:MAG: enoyl-CoA hydratase-related protein [Actinomycetota bacterium]